MNEIIKKQDSLDLTNKLNQAENIVFDASKPSDMLEGVFILSEARDAIKQAKNAIKEFEKDPKAIIKDLETTFKRVEEDLKAKVVETYESEIVVKQKTDDETGEVSFKEYENNNLGKSLFTFSKAKSVTAEAVDYKAMLAEPEKYKDHLIEVISHKIAPSIANISLEDAKKLGLPISKQTTESPAKVGIQWVQVQKKLLENKEGKNE